MCVCFNSPKRSYIIASKNKSMHENMFRHENRHIITEKKLHINSFCLLRRVNKFYVKEEEEEEFKFWLI